MRWSYKTVHFSLKKDGLLSSAFIDENEIEITLNDFGKLGWELVSFMEVNDGLIAVFKQPFGRDLPVIVEEPTIAKYVQKVSGKEHQEPTRRDIIPQEPKQQTEEIPVTPKVKVVPEKKQPSEISENEDAGVGAIKIF